MSDVPAYKRNYTGDDERLNEPYRLYVDGASQRNVSEITGIPPRTIARYSKRDGWAQEQRERASAKAGSVLAAVLAATAARVAVPENVSAAASDALASGDVRAAIQIVLKKQQRFSDAIFDALDAALIKALDDAKAKGRAVTASLLFPFVALGEKVTVMQRKAHGIPDVTKLELEDKSAAKMHADAIMRRRQERLARVETAAVEAQPGPHGPM